MRSNKFSPNGDRKVSLVLTAGSAAGTETIPRGTIGPQRLRLVLYRLESGFYDSAEVRDRIAARAVSDLS